MPILGGAQPRNVVHCDTPGCAGVAYADRIDTPWPFLRAALKAARQQAAGAHWAQIRDKLDEPCASIPGLCAGATPDAEPTDNTPLKLTTWNLEDMMSEAVYDEWKAFCEQHDWDDADAVRRIVPPEAYDVFVADVVHPQNVAFAVRRDLNVTAEDVRTIEALVVCDPEDPRHCTRPGLELTVTHNGRPLKLLSVDLKSGCRRNPVSLPEAMSERDYCDAGQPALPPGGGCGDRLSVFGCHDEIDHFVMGDRLARTGVADRHVSLGYRTARRAMYSWIDVGPDGRVTGIYSGFSKPAIALSASPGSMLPINAEHTVPQAFFRGNTGPLRGVMRADIHHLFPTHKDPNQYRGHDPFGEIPDERTETWLGVNDDGSLYADSAQPEAELERFAEDTDATFEPPEGHEGNTARAVFYFYTMHPNTATRIQHIAADGLEQLYRWHRQDPPDAAELARNARVATCQGNRNPYVDHPELLCRAWGFACG